VSVPLLRVRELTVAFPGSEGEEPAVRGVSFDVRAGETLGILGESGSGKTMSLRALIGLVPAPGRVLAGEALWTGGDGPRAGGDGPRAGGEVPSGDGGVRRGDGEVLGGDGGDSERSGRDLLRMPKDAWRRVRGRQIAMVFQDPAESLDPVFSIGDQLIEVLRQLAGLSRSAARREAVRLLERVHIPAAERRLGDYSHQLSGGMRQRVTLALAIAGAPALLLADEPTTALDVTIQDQILSLLAELQEELGMAIVLVSHDLGVIAQCADRVLVMRAGEVLEAGTVGDVLDSPRHPYTAELLAAVPRMDAAPGGARNGG
jgi:ABC-type dipeptide/oligopeptide/nickel transport system ATPase component